MVLLQRLHAAWFLLYGAYVRRVADQAAAAVATEAVAMTSEPRSVTVTADGAQQQQQQQQQHRAERLAALEAVQQASRAQRGETARQGLTVAFDVINRLHAEGPAADEACYRGLMQVCAHSKLADDAKKVFGDMVQCGIIPDTLSYNAFVEAVVREEDDLSVHELEGAPASTYGCLEQLAAGNGNGAVGVDGGGAFPTALCLQSATDARPISQQRDTLILAGWACKGGSFEDWTALFPASSGASAAATTAFCTASSDAGLAEVQLAVHRGDEQGGGNVQYYPYISPLTLFDEVEALLAHWGDGLLTYPTEAVAATTTTLDGEGSRHITPRPPLQLQKSHPTLFWNCVWYFRRHDLPVFFLLEGPVEPKLPAAAAEVMAGSNVGGGSIGDGEPLEAQDVLLRLGLSVEDVDVVRSAQELFLQSRFAHPSN